MRFLPLNRSLNVVFTAHLIFMIIMNRTTVINVQRGDTCFFLDSKKRYSQRKRGWGDRGSSWRSIDQRKLEQKMREDRI